MQRKIGPAQPRPNVLGRSQADNKIEVSAKNKKGSRVVTGGSMTFGGPPGNLVVDNEGRSNVRYFDE